MTNTHTTQTARTTPVSANLAVVRRFVDEILNRGRFDVMGELVHPDYRYHGPDGVELSGHADLEDLIGGFRRGFSDLWADVTAEIEDGDLIAVTMTLTGTHDGDFVGMPPTGARIELPIAIVTRLEGTQIVEDWEYYDSATMLAQLGVDPTAVASPPGDNDDNS